MLIALNYQPRTVMYPGANSNVFGMVCRNTSEGKNVKRLYNPQRRFLEIRIVLNDYRTTLIKVNLVE